MSKTTVMMNNFARYRSLAHYLVTNHALQVIVQAFHEAQVPVIVLKGAALVNSIYPDPSVRYVGDIDLLVHPADQERACRILEAAGYIFRPEREEFFNPFRSAFTGEKTYQSERNPSIFIDLHWELISIEWLRKPLKIDLAAIWQEAVPLKVNDVQALQLSPVHTLLHLCIHLVTNNFAHIKGYQDIAQLLQHYPEFPWDEWVRLAGQWRVRSCCYFVLSTAVAAWEALVPAAVLDVLKPPAWQRWLVVKIADPLRCARSELGYSHARSYLLHAIIADRLYDSIKLWLWVFFPGAQWLVQRYKLPNRWAGWLACLWHPFFVLGQGISSLWNVVVH